MKITNFQTGSARLWWSV